MAPAKIICVLLILHFSYEQSNLNIEIGGRKKSLSCSNDVGKIDFTLNYTTFSLIDELISYFSPNFKDPSKQKYYSICKLSISENEIEPSTNLEKPITYIEKTTNVPKPSTHIEETTNKLKPSTHTEETTNIPKPVPLIEPTINQLEPTTNPSTLIESTTNQPKFTTDQEASIILPNTTIYIPLTTNEPKPSTLIESTINQSEPTINPSTLIESTINQLEFTTDREDSTILPNPTTYIPSTPNVPNPSTLIEFTSNVPKLSIFETEPSTSVVEPSTFETELATFEAEHSTYEVEPFTSEKISEYIPDYNHMYGILEKLRLMFQEKLEQYFVYSGEEKGQVHPITTFPWISKLETETDLVGFDFIDANNDDYTWTYYFNDYSDGHSSSHGYIYSPSYDEKNQKELYPDNWMILPSFSLPIDYRFPNLLV